MSAQAPLCSAGETGGRVWRDFNNDGLLDAEETSGVAGVVVTAYDDDGAVESTTSDNFGYYVFTTLNFPNSYRVEFSSLPAPYAQTFQSQEVQFVEAAACDVNFGVNDPTDYCEDNPYVVTACYVGGDNSGTGDVLVGAPYNQIGDIREYAVENEIGSTWGLAYKRASRELFSAAVIKRHTGLGPGGIGAIYRTDIQAGTSNLLYDFGAAAGAIGSNADRGLTTPDAPSYDTEAFYLAGKAGLGDLDISTDESTLWVVNLNDGGLYSLSSTAPASNSAVAAPPIPSLACPVTVPTITDQLIDCGSSTATNAATGYLPDVGRFGTDPILALSYGAPFTPTGSEYPFHRFGFSGDVSEAPVMINSTTFSNEALRNGNFVFSNTSQRLLHYRIPVPNGFYEVDLGFHLAAGNLAITEMDVTLEDVKVLDAYKPAMALVAEEQNFTTTVADGILNITFTSNLGTAAIINAIRVTQVTDANDPPTATQRPWGLKVHNDGTGDKIYVGVVCSAEESGRDQDLQANVMVYDPATTSWSGPVLSFSLNFSREEATLNDPANWIPWSDSYQNNLRNLQSLSEGDGGTPMPQPIISDIEFEDNGDMILGMLDRGGLQIGFANYRPEAPYGPGGTELVTLVSAGDLMRAGKTGANSWTIENDGQVTNSVTGVTNSGSTASPAGPGGREFYFGENYSGAGHLESSFGGISIYRSANEIIHTALDASRTTANAGGLQWLNNTDGSFSFGIDLYDENTTGSFAKAVGLGDVELLCNPAPQQIGNYVWNDIDRDGVADPLEDPIEGVTVALYANVNGTLTYLANTTTDAAGEYYFTGIGTPGENWESTSGTDSIMPLTDYVVVFGYDGTTPQFANNELVVGGQNYFLTQANTGNGTSPDQNDSDATLMPVAGVNYPSVSITTGIAGVSNPRTDAGFWACPTITSPSAAQTICEGDAGDDMTVVTNQNAPNSIRFVRFSTDQTATNGSETAMELATIYAGGMNLDTVTPIGVDDPFTATLAANSGSWAPGTYYVYATLAPDPGPTCRPIQEIEITIVDRPDISANALTVCESMPGSGATADLVALVQNPDGATLAFAEGANAITTPMAADLAAGEHLITVTATNALSGCDSMVMFTVTVQEFPTAQPLCPGESVTLTAPAAAMNVIWYRDGLIVGNGPTYDVLLPGSYTYTADSGGGCSTGSCCPVVFEMGNCMSVGSTVFVDSDNNGVQDLINPLETGIPSVLVELYFDANNDGVIDGLETTPYAMMTTDGNGNYFFDNLPPGNYQVGIPMPDVANPISSTGQNTTNDLDLSDDGAQTGSGTATLSPIFNLAPGMEPTETSGNPGADQDDASDSNGNMTIDFGFFAPVSVGDTTFVDLDGNGLQSPGDVALVNATVTIIDNSTGLPVALDAEGNAYAFTQMTDGMGAYLFDNLPPGDYYVTFDISTADNAEFYDFTTPNSGNDLQDSDAVPATPTANVANSAPTGPLTSGQSDLTLDAGVICAVSVNLANPFTVCATQKITLNERASISPVSLDGTWSTSDGTGDFDNGNLFSTATTYTPSPEDAARGSVTLVLTTEDPAGPCLPVSNTITIEILQVDCGSFFWDGKE